MKAFPAFSMGAALGAVLGGVLLFSVRHAPCLPEPEEEAQAEEQAADEVGAPKAALRSSDETPRQTAQSGFGCWVPGVPTYFSPSLSQMLFLDESRFITLVNEETLSDGTTQTIRYEYSTSFDVEALAWRGTEEFYLAGRAVNGDTVIEQWVVHPRFARMELVRGTILPPVRVMNVDPEGRFLLVVAEDDVVYSLEIEPNATPRVLYDSSTLWTLPRVTHVLRYQHAVYGRIWSLFALRKPDAMGYVDSVPRIILLDSDNDGLFESFLIETEENLQALGISDSDQWLDDFWYYH